MKRRHTSPWGLTPSEVIVMDAMLEHGHQKRVAAELGLSKRTVEHHCQDVGRKMSLPGAGILKYLLWDRWRRNGHSAEDG